MKINELHELNIIFLKLLDEKFSSAVEYYLNKMVELEECIKNVRNVRIKFDEEFVENGEKILGINF